MAKRALLVGCNYPGSEAALNGCVNDVFQMKQLLVTRYGFDERDITVMIDTDPSYTSPTGKNVKDGLAQLVNGAKDGDVIFFHFSGHGTQVPADGDDYEIDGKDEAIVPTDMNVIVDDDLRTIFMPLSPGVHLTIVTDCCHSGGMLDHAEIVISGDKGGAKASSGTDMMSVLLGSLGGRDYMPKNRSLDVASLANILTARTGQQVAPNNVRSTLTSVFGSDASRMAIKYADQYLSRLGNPQAVKAARGLLSMLTKCMAAPATQGSSAPPPVMPVPGQKPPPSQQLHKDVGVLITGCQSSETSADACPSGDKTQAYGALTNGISTVLARHNGPITFKQLVTEVRNHMKEKGFTQNPCLECSAANADKVFIC
eukprot:jgi/Chlat1/6918/Chrsp52S06592